MKKYIISALLLATASAISQVGIGSTDPKAALDIVSTTSGLIIPRVTDHTALIVATAQTGMQVYNTTTKSIWLWDGTVWVENVDGVDKSKWTNDTAYTLVKLTNLSDGTSTRTAGKEFVVTDAGNLGIGTSSPLSTLDVNGSFGANQISTDATTYSFAATDYAVRLTLVASQSVNLPTIGLNSRRIVVLINPTSFDKTIANNAYQDVNGGFSFLIPANSSITLQNIQGTGWALINKELYTNYIGPTYPATATVTPTGLTAATAIDLMTINIPGAGTWEIEWGVRGVVNGAITGVASVLTDNSNVVQSNSEVLSVHSTTTGSMHGTGLRRYNVTTTGATTYKIRIYGVGGLGGFAASDANGRSWVSAKRIR